MLEYIAPYFVWLVEYCDSMADGAFEFALAWISFARFRREISEAFSAAALITLWTFKEIIFNHEANWALIICWQSL